MWSNINPLQSCEKASGLLSFNAPSPRSFLTDFPAQPCRCPTTRPFHPASWHRFVFTTASPQGLLHSVPSSAVIQTRCPVCHMKAAMVAVSKTGANHGLHHHDAGTRTLERSGTTPEVSCDTERSRSPQYGCGRLPAGDGNTREHPARNPAQKGAEASRAALLARFGSLWHIKKKPAISRA